MGDKTHHVWSLFMRLTGLDPMELQTELNPIIKKLKVNLENIQVHDIRRIVAHYMKSIVENERLKSVAFEEDQKREAAYNHN